MKSIPLIIIITIIITIFVYAKFFQPMINVGGHIKYDVISTEKGFLPVNVSAFGVLKLTNDQPKDINQIFKIDLVDNKIILNEGIVNKNGTIVMSSAKILNVLSMTENELVAKNDIWTITLTKNSVIFIDKDGKEGRLVSGFVGNSERDL